MNEEHVQVILPCLDEAGALPEVLGALPPGYTAIVVDNGSTDGSPELAARLGAKVVHEPRKGYGAAVHTGLETADTDIVCFIDADGSLDPAELPKLVAAVHAGADLAVGRRRPQSRQVWPWHARIANRLLAFLMRRKGIPVHDIAPARAGGRKALLALGVEDRAFGYPLELLIKASRAEWAFTEFDVCYSARAEGTKSKVSGTVRGTLRAIRDMSKALAS